MSNLSDDLFAWYGPDCVDVTEQRTPGKEHFAVRRNQAAFLGVELVDWLHGRVPRLFRRSDAITYARQLLVDGLIYHVDVEDGCHDFDECCLYAFTPEPGDMHRANWR